MCARAFTHRLHVCMNRSSRFLFYRYGHQYLTYFPGIFLSKLFFLWKNILPTYDLDMCLIFFFFNFLRSWKSKMELSVATIFLYILYFELEPPEPHRGGEQQQSRAVHYCTIYTLAILLFSAQNTTRWYRLLAWPRTGEIWLGQVRQVRFGNKLCLVHNLQSLYPAFVHNKHLFITSICP